MKTLVLFLLLGISWNLSAQSPDEKNLKAAVEGLRKAMIAADKQALEGFAADALSYGHSSGLVEDKATFVEAIASGKSHFISIALTDESVKIAGDIGIVRNKFSGEMGQADKPTQINISVLMVWQKQNGHWKLLARQGYRIPEKK